MMHQYVLKQCALATKHPVLCSDSQLSSIKLPLPKGIVLSLLDVVLFCAFKRQPYLFLNSWKMQQKINVLFFCAHFQLDCRCMFSSVNYDYLLSFFL